MFFLELSLAQNLRFPDLEVCLIGLTAPFNRQWEPLRKWQVIGWGRFFTAGLTSEWSLPWDQGPHLRKKENEIGVGVKKKGERSER